MWTQIHYPVGCPRGKGREWWCCEPAQLFKTALSAAKPALHPAPENALETERLARVPSTITREQAEGLGGALPPGAAGTACGGGPSVLESCLVLSGWTSGKLLYPNSRESY